MMKIKAKIFQIIRWEKKEKYFFNTDFGTEPVDLLHVAQSEKEEAKFYDEGFLGLIGHLIFKRNNPAYKYKNFIFHARIHYGERSDYERLDHAKDGLTILVKRPNNFQVGDIIDIDINISVEAIQNDG